MLKKLIWKNFKGVITFYLGMLMTNLKPVWLYCIYIYIKKSDLIWSIVFLFYLNPGLPLWWWLPLILVHQIEGRWRGSMEEFEGRRSRMPATGGWCTPVRNMLHHVCVKGLNGYWTQEVWEWWQHFGPVSQ